MQIFLTSALIFSAAGAVDLSSNESLISCGADPQITYEHDVLPYRRVRPIYPRRAISRQIEGLVELEFQINSSGTPENIEVLQSEPQGMFDRGATNAISGWRFSEPALNSKVTIRYRLGEKAQCIIVDH